MPTKLYKSKPTVVSAEQYFPGKGVKGVIDITDKHGQCGRVLTPHGPVVVSPGEWIITDDEGRHPVKDDTFKKTYEEVNE